MNLWFAISYEFLDGYKYKIPKFEGEFWQILEYENTILLIATDEIFSKWTENNLFEYDIFIKFDYLAKEYYCIQSSREFLLRPANEYLEYVNDDEAISFSLALDKTMENLDKSISLHDGIFIEKYLLILPVYSNADFISNDYVLGSWITGGVNISANYTKRILGLTRLKKETVLKISKGNEIIEEIKKDEKIKLFSLPGRPELENFFNEHVIDIINNKERYNALGIQFPSAVILHGPPGSGKTYAVEQLINLLDWPSYKIEASSIASPFIHETSKKIADIFQTAIQNSPSVIIIDEMEAFLANRDNTHSQHHIEEMAEFLRRIPEAAQNEVLIIAMTNKINMIDPAILRRGRFDHILFVNYASEQEIESMIKSSLKSIATQDDIDVKTFAKKLSEKPLSDVSFFLKEGARLAARDGKNKLDNKSPNKALEITLNKNQKKNWN